MKFTLPNIIVTIAGVIATYWALNYAANLSGPALCVLYCGIGVALHTIWEKTVLKDIDTLDEILTNNLSYALYAAIPAIIFLAACIAAVG